jgi:YgiT-type zinc finger domain-containing protein
MSKSHSKGDNIINITEAIKGLQCPICGNINSYRLRSIDKIERVGNNTVILPIIIGQCDFCGEQIMDAATTTKVFEARKKLAEGALADLTRVGETYRAS